MSKSNNRDDCRTNAGAEESRTRREVLGVGAALGMTLATGNALLTPSASARSQDQGQVQSDGSGDKLSADRALTVAVVVFDRITQLDATAPIEVFAKAGLSVFTVAPELALVTSGSGLKIMPDYDFASAPQADILCVPGGGGVNPLLTDPATLAYIRRSAGEARYVTSVCTGALLLGAAGLLNGKRATTHWASHHFLEAFGAIPKKSRVVIDGNVITGGGVTAGVDFAFTVLEEIQGREAAALTMLSLEYDPAPPFAGGSPESTSETTVAAYKLAAKNALAARGRQVALAAKALKA